MRTIYLMIAFLMLQSFTSINLKADNKLDSVYKVLEYYWQNRDGEMWFTIDNAIVEVIIISPESSLKWLNDKKEIKSELLKEWQNSVFTDYTGTNKLNIETIKKELIKALKKVKIKNNDIVLIKNEMLKSLEGIKILQVE
jgi:hypothetical protein